MAEDAGGRSTSLSARQLASWSVLVDPPPSSGISSGTTAASNHESRGRVCCARRRPSIADLTIDSQIRRIDSQLDRLQLSTANDDGAFAIAAEDAHDPHRVARIEQLQRLIKNLSTTNSSKHSLVPASRIRSILQEAEISSQCATCAYLFEQDDSGSQHRQSSYAHESSYEHELEWLLLSKATTQAYGSVLSTILEQTIPLEDDIWYWDDIISTYRFAGLYSIQTSPIRLYNWSRDVYRDVKDRGGRLAADGWREFYTLVRDTIKDRNVREIQRRVVSPLGVARNEGRKKSAALRRIRMKNANALGLLLGEGLGSDR